MCVYVCECVCVCVCARMAYPRIDFKIKSTNFLRHFDEYFVISFDTMQIYVDILYACAAVVGKFNNLRDM